MSFFLRRPPFLLGVRPASALRRLVPVQTCPQVTRRSFFNASAVARSPQQRAPIENDAAAVASEFADLDKRLFSLRIFHSQLSTTEADGIQQRQRAEQEGWEMLRSVPEEAVDQLSTTTVAEIVQTYHYFSRFWEYGVDGPATASASGFASRPGAAASVADGVREPFEYPILDRFNVGAEEDTVARKLPLSAVEAVDTHYTVARPNPLDQVFDF